jgi:IPT/TIG domain
MKTWFVVALVCMVVALYAQGLPRCATLEPDTGKTGDMISVKGENLDKKSTGDLFLTDGSKDTKVSIAEQSETEIKFKIPQIKPGRYHLAILTANKASIIEQPVVLTVE